MEHYKTEEGKVGWRCPSNIAIVKYWGKYGVQYPRNASISLTLSEAHTDTNIHFSQKDSDGISFEFTFEGEKKASFESKIQTFLQSVTDYFPYLNHYHLKIDSSNSFPHSSGIASSASAMAALAMCLCEIEVKLEQSEKIDVKKVSEIARLGSGSASRSVIPKVGIWGLHPQVLGSSNDYAIKAPNIHPVFNNFHDDILIVSASEKPVSSRAGHALMNNNPYADVRYQQANDRLVQVLQMMQDGELEGFGEILEDEAMTLHALMMCSNPSYILIEPNTLNMIQAIRRYRSETKIPVYFTLDAGPNIHLLYPDEYRNKIQDWQQDELMQWCANGRIIKDQVGDGPIRI